MTLNEMIFQRKSCRSFLGRPVDAEMIEKILSFELKPLYPQIKVRMDIVSRDKVRWKRRSHSTRRLLPFSIRSPISETVPPPALKPRESRRFSQAALAGRRGCVVLALRVPSA